MISVIAICLRKAHQLDKLCREATWSSVSITSCFAHLASLHCPPSIASTSSAVDCCYTSILVHLYISAQTSTIPCWLLTTSQWLVSNSVLWLLWWHDSNCQWMPPGTLLVDASRQSTLLALPATLVDSAIQPTFNVFIGSIKVSIDCGIFWQLDENIIKFWFSDLHRQSVTGFHYPSFVIVKIILLFLYR